MSGAFGYEMDLGKCTPQEKAEIRRQVEWYKEHYELLHHGEYYRLSSPLQNDSYTAWEQVSSDKREALVSVVLGTSHAAPPFRNLRFKGLNPAFQYRIGENGMLYSGEYLMKAGYPVPQMQGDYSAFQIYMRAD